MAQAKRETVRVAQVGCGYWGRNLLRVLNQLSETEIPLVIEQSPAAQNYIKLNYPWIEVESDIERIINDDSIDAVVVATPAADHFATTSLALMANKNVFVEKPLALNESDARTLVNLADVRGLTLMAGHTFLYNNAVRKVKEIIDSGELGDVLYISGRRLNLGIVRQDVNALWNLAPHDISIILYWLGEYPTSSSAHGGNFLQPGIEDVVFLNMAFASGAVANVHLSWLDPHKVRDMTIVGTKKMVVFDDVSSDAKVTIYDMGIDVEPKASKGASFESFSDFQLIRRYGSTVIPRIEYPEPLAEELKHFANCIQTGETPLTGGEHAIGVVKVLQEADESLQASRNDMAHRRLVQNEISDTESVVR